MAEKVVLGLSGGVDSAVSACLLREAGYEVYGMYMDNGLPGAEAARQTAEALKIPLSVRDSVSLMEKEVFAPFAASYLHGQTPNPCVLCNPAVKFRLLLEEAETVGADWIATGHYARVENGALYRGAAENDQSYMLCRLLPEQVDRLILPLGPFSKSHVRDMAAQRGLAVASKPDSMEICFIPDGDYSAWIESRGVVPPPGEFLLDGVSAGTHRGIHHYTLGQRKHFGVGFGKRVYVSQIRPETDQVCLSSDESVLWRESFFVRDLRWLDRPGDGEICGVRVRHSRSPIPPCRIRFTEDGVRVDMADGPIRAPTPGQAAAFYRNDQLLGGGFIMN